MTPGNAVDPSRIVWTEDYSEKSFQNIISSLRVSTDFEHLVYRECELNAVWSLLDLAIKYWGVQAEELPRLERLQRLVEEAYGLLGNRQPEEAARRLQQAL